MQKSEIYDISCRKDEQQFVDVVVIILLITLSLKSGLRLVQIMVFLFPFFIVTDAVLLPSPPSLSIPPFLDLISTPAKCLHAVHSHLIIGFPLLPV